MGVLMAPQLALPGLLEQGAGTLRIYSGYSWTMPDDILDLSAGIVSGPKWSRKSCSEYPSHKILLDNGAFPAWVAGENLTFDDQLGAVLEAAKHISSKGLLDAIIAPDIVGGGAESWHRTMQSIEALRQYPLLLPVQEGIDIEQAVSVCEKLRAGLFIGGKTFAFKLQAAKQINGRVYTHVGRVNRDGWLWTFSRLVDAVDSTSWVRAQHWNKKINWAQILRRYAGDV